MKASQVMRLRTVTSPSQIKSKEEFIMKKFKHYSKKEKELMVMLYEAYKNYHEAARNFGCAMSTVYYAVNEDAYEHHKEHVLSKQKERK